MQIWHFCRSPISYELERGGVSNVVSQISGVSARVGVTTKVICSDQDLGRTVGQVGVLEIGDCLQVRTIHQHKNILAGPFEQLRSIIRQMPDDAVAHVHGCFSAFSEISMAGLHRQSVPFIFSPHGKLSAGMIATRGFSKMLMWKILTRRFANNASLVGIFSPGEGGLFEKLGLKIPRVVIPNGFSQPNSSGANEPPAIEGKYFLFLGFLDPRKQPSFLIEAFAKSDSRKTHKLVFVGPDAYQHRERLLEITRFLGLSKKVIFFGPAYGDVKWNLLRNAVSLCLPSLAEGMPLVLLEALGALTPSIFSRECNAGEIAYENAGLEVASFDVDLWAKALDAMSENVVMRHRMSENAQRIRQRYEWSEIGRRWLEVYRSLNSERRNGWLA